MNSYVSVLGPAAVADSIHWTGALPVGARGLLSGFGGVFLCCYCVDWDAAYSDHEGLSLAPRFASLSLGKPVCRPHTDWLTTGKSFRRNISERPQMIKFYNTHASSLCFPTSWWCAPCVHTTRSDRRRIDESESGFWENVFCAGDLKDKSFFNKGGSVNDAPTRRSCFSRMSIYVLWMYIYSPVTVVDLPRIGLNK